MPRFLTYIGIWIYLAATACSLASATVELEMKCTQCRLKAAGVHSHVATKQDKRLMRKLGVQVMKVTETGERFVIINGRWVEL